MKKDIELYNNSNEIPDSHHNKYVVQKRNPTIGKSFTAVLKEIKKKVNDPSYIVNSLEKTKDHLIDRFIHENKVVIDTNKEEDRNKLDEINKQISSDLADFTKYKDDLNQMSGYYSTLFDVVLNVTESDAVKVCHHIEVPYGLYDVKDTPKGVSIVALSPVHTGDENPKELHPVIVNKIWNFYSTVKDPEIKQALAEDFDKVMALSPKTDKITYQSLYRFVRFFSVIKGFVGFSPKNETTLSDMMMDKIDSDGTNFEAFIETPGFAQLKEFTTLLLICKAISWFTVGHNVGVGKFSNIWMKSLAVYSNNAWDSASIGILYDTLYNVIHFASCKNILYAYHPILAGNTYEYVKGSVMPGKIPVDNFLEVRKTMAPAGAANLALADATLDKIFALNLGGMISDNYLLKQLFKSIGDMRLNPANYHIGSFYLTGQATRNECSQFKRIFRDICSYIRVFEDGTTISKSTAITKIEKEGSIESTPFYSLCTSIKESMKSNENAVSLIINSITLGSQILNKKLPAVDIKDVVSSDLLAEFRNVSRKYISEMNGEYKSELDIARGHKVDRVNADLERYQVQLEEKYIELSESIKDYDNEQKRIAKEEADKLKALV